jgi:ubiquinone biosynthesis monooxygenase Coq7
MPEPRHYTGTDRWLARADNALRTLVPGSTRGRREAPTSASGNPATTRPPEGERAHIAGLMRINHTGEVCAQALYQGQATTARLPDVRAAMEESAREEEDHLAWCEQRISELGGHPSRLNPVFYALSFSLGAAAGLIGDRWSLGFVAETEHQVVRHLESHLERIPPADEQSRRIIAQMRDDELQHAVTAQDAGGAELPPPVRTAMTVMSKIMTFTTYRW